MKRVEALDIAKGFAILCVVVGHVVSRGTVPGADWYTHLKIAIYTFHMPLFMALSGMAFGLSWRRRGSWSSVGELVQRRIRTLMVPYLLFGVVIICGKIAAQRFMHVDNPPQDILHGIGNVVLYPMQSASVFLWYIQVLALYFLTIPWLMQVSEKGTPWVLLFLGVVLNTYDWTAFLNIAGFVEYLPFFGAGILIGQHWNRLVSSIASPKYWIWWMIPFGAAVAYGLVYYPLPKWFVGTLAIPAVLVVAEKLSGRVAETFTHLGNNTFPIYLMNTIFIGLTKGVLLPFIPWRDHYFIFYFFSLAAAGLLLPILVKGFLVRYQPKVAAYI